MGKNFFMYTIVYVYREGGYLFYKPKMKLLKKLIYKRVYYKKNNL